MTAGRRPEPAAAAAPAGAPAGEVQLEGGTANSGLVVRVGDTVHRPRGRGSDGVHALLRHLEREGFDGAPLHVGEDELGREVLTFVEGDAATAPHPPWALTDDALVSVAELLRRYHDAARSFDPVGHRWATAVPSAYRSDAVPLVAHNDPNLDNVVFRGGRAVALIDFDLASPASALWDVALAARLWVPLRDPADVPDVRVGRSRERLRLFADAYGLARAERARLAEAAARTHTWCYDIIRVGVSEGRQGYARYWTPEAQGHDERGRAWLEANLADLDRALR